jgi:hypothetical protein
MKVRLLGFVNHVLKDVRPWARRYRSWKTYQADWPPNNANACRVLHVEAQQPGAKVVWRGEPNQPDRESDRMEQVSKVTGEGLPSALKSCQVSQHHNSEVSGVGSS